MKLLLVLSLITACTVHRTAEPDPRIANRERQHQEREEQLRIQREREVEWAHQKELSFQTQRAEAETARVRGTRERWIRDMEGQCLSDWSDAVCATGPDEVTDEDKSRCKSECAVKMAADISHDVNVAAIRCADHVRAGSRKTFECEFRGWRTERLLPHAKECAALCQEKYKAGPR